GRRRGSLRSPFPASPAPSPRVARGGYFRLRDGNVRRSRPPNPPLVASDTLAFAGAARRESATRMPHGSGERDPEFRALASRGIDRDRLVTSPCKNYRVRRTSSPVITLAVSRG